MDKVIFSTNENGHPQVDLPCGCQATWAYDETTYNPKEPLASGVHKWFINQCESEEECVYDKRASEFTS